MPCCKLCSAGSGPSPLPPGRAEPLFLVQEGVAAVFRLPPAACFGSSGLGTVPTVPGTPRWRARCSNLVFSLSLHPSPPPSDLHDQIIKTIKGLPWQGDDPRRLLQSLSRLQKPRTFIL